MEARLNLMKVAPKGAYEAVSALQHYVNTSGLEHTLLQLVEIRASQINGCAYCIDMHTKDARALGESEQRIYLLDAWRESPFYTNRERAALEWTEALTLITGRPRAGPSLRERQGAVQPRRVGKPEPRHLYD